MNRSKQSGDGNQWQYINTLSTDIIQYLFCTYIVIQFLITVKLEAYDKIWVVGDKFVHESQNIIKRYFGFEEKHQNDHTQSVEKHQSYIGDNYDVKVFTGYENRFNRSVLGHLHNAFVAALNANGKLPKMILVVIEDDIIKCVNFDKAGISQVFGRCVQWLADEIRTAIHKHKADLPGKCKKNLYPQVFWVAIPSHLNFLNNHTRFKFNQSLETVLLLYNEMKVLKLQRRWQFNDTSVSIIGQITPPGFTTYWSVVDEAIQFWENGRKRKPVGKGSGQEFVNQMYDQHERATFNNHN